MKVTDTTSTFSSTITSSTTSKSEGTVCNELVNVTIRYDTIRYDNLTSTKKLSVVSTRNQKQKWTYKRKKLKETNASAHLVRFMVRFKSMIREGSPNVTHGVNDL